MKTLDIPFSPLYNYLGLKAYGGIRHFGCPAMLRGALLVIHEKIVNF